MEMIAKMFFYGVYLVPFIGFSQTPDWAYSLEQITYQEGVNTVHASYVKEKLDYQEHKVRSVSEMNLNDNTVYIQFFSEVDSTFKFYLDDELVASHQVNTYIKPDGSLDIFMYPIQLPILKNERTLKVKSLKYGTFTSVIKKDYPMVYAKYDNNNWYVEHSDVDRIAIFYFSK
jgi:hypothetical protein